MKKKAIFFMTGMSNYGNNSLSFQQEIFLKNLLLPENVEKIYINFPYTEAKERWRHTNIFIASISNMFQYFKAKFPAEEKHKKVFLELLNKYDEIFILAGSCGLEIFNSLNLDGKLAKKINIFSYGGVASKIPKVKNVFLIRGSKDFLAIRKYDIIINCGHMNYLTQLAVKNFIEEKIK